jgi:hypothetical protein
VAGEEALPRRLVLFELAAQVVDPLEHVGGALGRWLRARAPRLGLHGAPERDGLLHLVGPSHEDEVDVAEQPAERGAEVDPRVAEDGAGTGDEVVDVAPHELAFPDAVRRRAAGEDALPPLARRLAVGVAGRRAQRREAVEHAEVVHAVEVLAGLARRARVAQDLEVLEGTPGDARRAQQLAEERAAAARGGADEVCLLGWSHGKSPFPCRQ